MSNLEELDRLLRLGKNSPQDALQALQAFLSKNSAPSKNSVHPHDWFHLVQSFRESLECIDLLATYGSGDIRKKNFIHAMMQYDRKHPTSNLTDETSKIITSAMLRKYPDLLAERVSEHGDYVIEVAVSVGADWLIPDESILPSPHDDCWEAIRSALKGDTTDRPILAKAVDIGDIAMVRKVIKLLQDLSLDQSSRGIALFQAIRMRNLKFVELLLEIYPAMVIWETHKGESVLDEVEKTESFDDKIAMKERLISTIFHQGTLRQIRRLIRIETPDSTPEVYVDLSDFNNSASLDFNRFLARVNNIGISLYHTLAYIQLPVMPELRLPTGKEAITVLNWLFDKGVRTILDLKVPDSLEHPHCENEIEKTLQKFTAIESLDWRILDMSLEVVKNIHGLEKLCLYSSGNRDVLNYWTGREGLVTLQVQMVTIYIIETRPLNLSSRALDRLSERNRDREFKYTIASTPSWANSISEPPKPYADDGNNLSLFLRTLRTFHDYFDSPQNPGHVGLRANLADVDEATGLSSFLRTFRLFSPCPTRVAIIDTGIDLTWEEISCTVQKGVSFVEYKSTMGKTHESPWWVASEPHGTQMASLVAKLNPHCKLLIAKVGATRTDISIRNVIQAIKWATAERVDVISFSMTINRYDEALEREVKRASDKDILFFCSTEDIGASGRTPYPAQWSELTYPISGTDVGGKEVTSSDRNAKYYFLGENIRTQSLSYGPSSVPGSGSSLATAVAAGTASLVLSCHKCVNGDDLKSRKKLVDRIFGNMKEVNDKYVYPGRFFATEPNQRWDKNEWRWFLIKNF